MGRDHLHIYLVIRETDAFFMSVHLTYQDAVEACDNSPYTCRVLEADLSQSCEYVYPPMGGEE